ncbi:hypothetical protein [Singulisphaera sp. PoT]|uniref:hypothetical protein n=1 Tax=Singulisphaera sp. PoT TaxID=3411797 RepID=UPI003BF4C3E5
MVAKALVAFPQPCPVLTHSSNGTRSHWMAVEFELGGCSYRRVPPSASVGSRNTGGPPPARSSRADKGNRG